MIYRRSRKKTEDEAKKKEKKVKAEKSEEQKAYEHYIRSKDFRQIRERVLERDQHRCRTCGRDQQEIEQSGKKISLQVHHSTYEHVGCCDQREVDDCIVLCSVCHKAVHSAKSNLQRFKYKGKILQNIEERNEQRNE